MLIKYDKMVLEEANRVAMTPGAVKRDMMRYLHDELNTAYDYAVPYLGKEAIEEIRKLVDCLPSGRRKATIGDYMLHRSKG